MLDFLQARKPFYNPSCHLIKTNGYYHDKNIIKINDMTFLYNKQVLIINRIAYSHKNKIYFRTEKPIGLLILLKTDKRITVLAVSEKMLAYTDPEIENNGAILINT